MSANKGVVETILNPSGDIVKNLDKVEGKLDGLDKAIDSIADKNLEKLTSSAIDLENVIDRIASKTKTLYKQSDKTYQSSAKTVSQSSSLMKNIEKGVKALSFKAMVNNFKKIFSMTSNFSQEAVDYIEDLNLLKVAFGDTANEAKKLVNNIAAITGFDEATLTRNLGTFRNLTSTLGAANEVADLLAMNLEKMSLDISSLYNVGLDRSAYALTGMLTGQPRTIKTLTGANITQNALQQDLVALGINRNVRELNKAEKAILSYISLEKQLMQSNGDMARTLEQPAQLLRVFREQLQKAARSIGSLLIPAIQAVIPYLTAFLMAFNEIVGALMTFLGVDADSFWEDMAAGAKETAVGIGSIGGAADKAKKGLRNFDKLNVITTPSKSGSGGGSGVGGALGIDNRLLAALKEYDLHLDKIKTKAVKIKNQIMKLLGFHEELNEETGKWEWKYDGIGKTIKNLLSAFIKLNPKAKILAGFITLIAGSAIYSGISKLVTKFGKTGFGRAINELLTPTKLLAENLLSIVSGKATIGLSQTVNDWSAMLTPIEKIGTALIGGGIVYTGLKLTQDGIKKIADESNKTFGIIETGVGFLGSIIGGGLSGAAVGGAAGGLIGGIIGGVTGIIKIIDEADTHLHTNIREIEEVEKSVNNLYKGWKESVEELQSTYAKAETETTYYQKLWKELQGIVDENGKIKKGYEDRAEVITTILSEALGVEIKVVDGNIQKWKDLQNEIDNYIIKRKNAIKLSALEAAATEAINKKAEAEKTLLEVYDKRNEAEKNLKDKISSLRTEYSFATEDIYDYLRGLTSAEKIAKKYNTTTSAVIIAMGDFITNTQKQQKALDKADSAYDKASKTLNGYNQTIKNYETALGLSLQNNQVALDKFFDHEQYLYGKSFEEQNSYWQERKKLNELGLKNLEETRDSYSKKDYEALKNSYTSEYDLINTEMDKLKLLINTKNGQLSDETINKWKEMGENSTDEFVSQISQLPQEIQTQVIDKMQEKGFRISEELQKGLDKNNITVGFKVDTSDANKKLKEFIEKWNKKLANSNLPSLNNGNYGESVQLKASGGFVNSGEVYVARENGLSEYIGRVGHKTAVANNDQIVEGITQGVRDAILSTGGFGGRPVVIKAEGDANGLMGFIRFKQQEDDMQFGN